MDTLKVIQDKVEILSSTLAGEGLSAVVRHLEIAESHYARAQENGDQDLFTDVIYRTNHAFEGILREAYTLLAEKNPRNKQTQQIEEYLIDKGIFKPRVTELFTQYRIQWRNPSTHEHKLFFSQQEAFLSILSVTSFVSILLDQMIEKAAYNEEKSLEATQPIDEDRLTRLQQMSLLDRVVEALRTFNVQMGSRPSKLTKQVEQQVTGRLHAYLDSIPEITIDPEPLFTNKGVWHRPDFVIKQKDDSVILEVKGSRRRFRSIKKEAELQTLLLLEAAAISSGVVFIYTPDLNEVISENKVEYGRPFKDHQIVYIYPKN